MRKPLGAAVLASLLAACGSSMDPYVAATPDAAGLTLETNGTNENAGATSTAALTVAGGGAQVAAALSTCQPYEYLCNVHAVVAGLNAFVHAAVDPIEALAQTTPTVSGDTKVFGPVNAPPAPATAVATFQLTVQEVSAGFFRWKLQGKPLGAADGAYVIVAAGAIHRVDGDLAHRGHGVLGIDLDALYGLNPPGAAPVWNGEGKLLVGFRHVGEAKSVLYALQDFSPDRSTTPPVPAAYVAGYRTASGIARVRLASVDEFVGPNGGGSDAGPELLLARAGWFPGLGGRAVVAVGGGDVPSYSLAFPAGAHAVDFFLGISCYDKVENEVYRHLYGCAVGYGCATVPNMPTGWDVGDPSLCVLGTELGVDNLNPPAAPGVDELSPATDPGAPATPDTPPAGMADVTF